MRVEASVEDVCFTHGVGIVYPAEEEIEDVASDDWGDAYPPIVLRQVNPSA